MGEGKIKHYVLGGLKGIMGYIEERKQCNDVIFVFYFSFVFHVDGFHDYSGGPINNTLGTKVNYLPHFEGRGAVPLNCVPQLSSSCVIAGIEQSDVVFYSSSEFAATEVIEVRSVFRCCSIMTVRVNSKGK